jgi:hypothetical protein
MPEPRPSRTDDSRPAFQGWLLLLAGASALVLLVGVARSLLTGESPPLLIAVATVLAASLMLLRSLRRTAAPRTIVDAPVDPGA